MLKYLNFVIRSFYSSNSYNDVYKKKINVFLYLLIIVTLFSMVDTIQATIGINTFVKNDFPHIANQVPDMFITNGKLSTFDNQATEIIIDNTPILVIDPNQSIYNLEPDDKSIRILGDGIVLEKNENQLQLIPFSDSLNLMVNSLKVEKIVQKWVPFIIIILFFCLVIGKFISILFANLFHIISGLIISKIQDTNITVSNIYLLAIYASTPANILKFIINLKNSETGLWWLYFIITICFLIFGIVSIKKKVNSDNEIASKVEFNNFEI